MKYLSWLIPFKSYIMAGAVAIGLLSAGIAYTAKIYKQHKYKRDIEKAKTRFEQCIKEAKTNSDYQLCFTRN